MRLRWEDADDIGAALDLTVEPFERIDGMVGHRSDGGIVEPALDPIVPSVANPCAMPMPNPMSSPMRATSPVPSPPAFAMRPSWRKSSSVREMKVENAVKVEPAGEFKLKGIRRPPAGV